MSESKQVQKVLPYVSALQNAERKFNEIRKQTNAKVGFKAESMFALQALAKNEFLMKVANNAPDSLRDSLINVAGTDMSLNPALQFAYLVPRDGIVVLDISYKGLIKLATDSGSMMWVRADMVYANDSFVYHGPALAPDHSADVFGDRGELKGGYVIAKTLEGDILAEVMPASEIHQVRDQSFLWKTKKSGPWKSWFGEMAKKTIIKRASKTWPRSDKTHHLAAAIDLLNKQDGVVEEFTEVEMISENQVNTIESMLSENDLDRAAFLNKVAGVNDVAHIVASDYERCHSALVVKIQLKKEASE